MGVITKLREKMSISEAKKDIFYVIEMSKYATKNAKNVNFKPFLNLNHVIKI